MAERHRGEPQQQEYGFGERPEHQASQASSRLRHGDLTQADLANARLELADYYQGPFFEPEQPEEIHFTDANAKKDGKVKTALRYTLAAGILAGAVLVGGAVVAPFGFIKDAYNFLVPGNSDRRRGEATGHLKTDALFTAAGAFIGSVIPGFGTATGAIAGLAAANYWRGIRQTTKFLVKANESIPRATPVRKSPPRIV